MKHLFESAEELQEAHEQLAFVEYLFANRKAPSQFICINLQNYAYGNFSEVPTPLNYEKEMLRYDVCRTLRDHIEGTVIAPYGTVESFLANRDGYEEPEQVDPEEAHTFRLTLLATLLAELA